METYLGALVDEAQLVLGENLVGAYVGGSLALDGYRQGTSDIDVALVVNESLTDLLRHALVARVRHEALPCPARGLELVIYRLEVAQSGTAEPEFELDLNTGAGMEFRATYRAEDRPEGDGFFWYAIDRSILRSHARVLFGPPPADVFAEVPGLRSLLADSVRWHLAHSDSAGVIAAHRALVRMRTGIWVSKAEAARIVQEEALRELTR